MHQLVTLLVVTTLCLLPVLMYVLIMVVNVLRVALSMRRLTPVLSWRIALRVSYCDDIIIALLDHMILLQIILLALL